MKLWLTAITCIAYCIDKELYHAIDYLKEQVQVLIEHQEKQDKRVLLIDQPAADKDSGQGKEAQQANA